MKLSHPFFVLAVAYCMMAAEVSAMLRHTETHVHCTTHYGAKSHVKRLPRATHTITTTVRGCTVTKRPFKHVTQMAMGKTATATSTAIVTSTDSSLQSTDTFTTTSTSTIVVPLTISETATITTTQTSTVTVTPTSTIPTGPNFTPIGGAPAPAATPLDRRDQIPVERDADSLAELLQARGQSPGGCNNPRKHAKSVKCIKRVEILEKKVVTKGKTRTITKYAPTPAPQTVTVTATSTRTVAPPNVTQTVSATITTSSTATATETSTVTTTATATETESRPSATVYAACAPESNNFVGANNVYNNGGGQCAAGSIFTSTSASSASDCCNQCQASEICQGSAFAGSRCIFLTTPNGNANCPASLQSAYKAGAALPGSNYQLSNGACSYFTVGC